MKLVAQAASCVPFAQVTKLVAAAAVSAMRSAASRYDCPASDGTVR
jgi:hypothetical protein